MNIILYVNDQFINPITVRVTKNQAISAFFSIVGDAFSPLQGYRTFLEA